MVAQSTQQHASVVAYENKKSAYMGDSRAGGILEEVLLENSVPYIWLAWYFVGIIQVPEGDGWCLEPAAEDFLLSTGDWGLVPTKPNDSSLDISEPELSRIFL